MTSLKDYQRAQISAEMAYNRNCLRQYGEIRRPTTILEMLQIRDVPSRIYADPAKKIRSQKSGKPDQKTQKSQKCQKKGKLNPNAKVFDARPAPTIMSDSQIRFINLYSIMAPHIMYFPGLSYTLGEILRGEDCSLLNEVFSAGLPVAMPSEFSANANQM